MIYRSWVNGKQLVTSNLDDLINCESVDIYINQFWQVYR